MDVKQTLIDSGLSEGEVATYLALLKLGSVQVSKIKEKTGLHRTTIYDFLEKLLNKGLVNYVIKNNIKYYKATVPEKLLDFIKEKQENIKNILPELKNISKTGQEEVIVEVYKGEEGFKTIMNDYLRTGEDMISFGIDESIFEKKFPILTQQLFKKEEKLGLKERLLTSENARFIYKRKTTTYRYIPKEFFNPNPIIVYGNKVATVIWDPFTVILVENAELADSYKKHFEMLWKIASKTQKKKKISFKNKK